MMNYEENQDDADSLDFSFTASNSAHSFLPTTLYSTVPFDYNQGKTDHLTHLGPADESLLQDQDPVHVPPYGSSHFYSESTSRAYLPCGQAASTDLSEPTNDPLNLSIAPEHEPVEQDLQSSLRGGDEASSFLGFSSQPNESYQRCSCLCAQCNQSFESHSDLNDHAMATLHDAYQCSSCHKTFSRIDCLQRHNRHKHKVELSRKYSCQYCEKWKAPNGFERKDHLAQHLSSYHHLPIDRKYNMHGRFPDEVSFHRYCLQQGCPLFRTEEEDQKPGSYPLFPSRAAFTKHTREVHNASIYPCIQPGCKKVGRKGFFRERDLMKHMKKEHNIDISEQAEPNANAETHSLDDNWFMNGVL